jgi:DNA polymerase-3 subunit epsilon
MMPWHRGRLLAWDTETTSAHPDTARIVTSTAIECGPDGVGQTHEWLLDPGVPISPGATAVHGITQQRAHEDGLPASQGITEIVAVLGDWLSQGLPVVVFNGAFDGTILHRETLRHGLSLPDLSPMIDAHVIDKHMDRFRRGKRTLTATAEHYGIRLDDAHTSAADALAAVRVAWKLAYHFPYLDMPLPKLHASQQVWRAEQAASLQEYFRSPKGGKPDAVVNGDWPIQQLPNDWTPQLVDVEEVPA